jgi:hypothetical protein
MSTSPQLGGTSFTVFLPDGNPDGARLVIKAHWTGVAIASPRSRYAKVRLEREELRGTGVYVLIGRTEGEDERLRIYVGEGENVRVRIDAHHAGRSAKDFWNRLIAFTSPSLNKATIRHLEARLLQLAATASRADIDNGTAPPLPSLSEHEVADAESFLVNMLMIFPILGVNLFEPLEQTTSINRLHVKGINSAGEGAESEDGFVVFKGALARAETVASMRGWDIQLRDKLIQSGVLAPVEDGSSLQFKSDYIFNSPSAAASVLLGRPSNGLDEWKDRNGKKLKEIREEAVSSSP